MRGKGLTAPTTILAAALAVTACARATPTTPPTTEGVLAKAREAMNAVQSYRIRGEIIGDTDLGTQEARYSAEFAAPGRTYQRFEGVGEAEGQVTELIAVDGRLFVRESSYQGGEWRERSVTGLQVTSGLPRDLDSPRLLADETVNGVSAFHVVAEHDPEQSETLPGTATLSATYHLFISQLDYRLVRLVTETAAHYTETTTVGGTPVVREVQQRSTITYDYYDYDQPVTIEVPEVNGR